MVENTAADCNPTVPQPGSGLVADAAKLYQISATCCDISKTSVKLFRLFWFSHLILAFPLRIKAVNLFPPRTHDTSDEGKKYPRRLNTHNHVLSFRMSEVSKR
jgi:hypothetical protein